MTTPSLPRPPSPFPSINTQIIRPGEILHRTHASDFRPAQFNPCKGQATRFAPFLDDKGTCVPTLYAATNKEAAAFESIFHDIEPNARFKTVRLDVIESRSVSTITQSLNANAAEYKGFGESGHERTATMAKIETNFNGPENRRRMYAGRT